MGDNNQTSVFREATEHAANVDRSWYEKDFRSVFIDPKRIVGTHDEKIAIIKEMFKEQYPKLGAKITDKDAQFILDKADEGPAAGQYNFRYKTPGPHGRRQTQPVCVVLEAPESMDTKKEVVSTLTNFPVDQLKNIPGDQALWDKIIGTHEGTHCDTDSSLITLEKERIADVKALEMLKKGGHDDVARALIDYRILGAAKGNDTDHATGLALESGEKITPNYIAAAKSFGQTMVDKVMSVHGISKADALQMRKDDPEKYIQTIEDAYNKGEFKDPNNGYVEKNVGAYVGAFRRQVKGVTPPSVEQKSENKVENNPNAATPEQSSGASHDSAPAADVSNFMSTSVPFAVADENQFSVAPSSVDLTEIEGGQAKVDLKSDDRASLTIGGVDASSFFASVAHPELAAERIAMQDMTAQNIPDFSFLPEQQFTNNATMGA
ncbi:MAG: hypothetical protein COA45_10805 [Zetaproteobacteria bacterium]|nr:MAG: hypothetical protein COA45_10805 [Zetaproteobacteria bacterium]